MDAKVVSTPFVRGGARVGAARWEAAALLRRATTGPRAVADLCFPARRLAPAVDAEAGNARLVAVEVVLRKLGKGSRAVAGRLVRAPRKGSVVVIEFPDGMHEYVTTPVKRVLRLAGREVFYIETINSRYRLEVRSREDAVAESAG
jgi:hypothetical protein